MKAFRIILIITLILPMFAVACSVYPPSDGSQLSISDISAADSCFSERGGNSDARSTSGQNVDFSGECSPQSHFSSQQSADHSADENTLSSDDSPISSTDEQENGSASFSPPASYDESPDASAAPTEEETSVIIAPTKEKNYAVSTVDGLRVRTQPNNSCGVLGSLDKGDAVTFIEKIGDYIKTVYKQKTAYVYADYCEIMNIEAESPAVEAAIDIGCELLGYPYVWGSQRYHWGNGILNALFVQGEFDCSALVQYVYYIADGIVLDLTTRTQVYNGKEVALIDLRRGDLMFFTNSSRVNNTGIERIGHVGIYFGNNYILHTASDHAVIEPISQTRWSYFITARRVA